MLDLGTISIFVRRNGCDAYVARCGKTTASCTAGPREAAERLASRIFGLPASALEITESTGGPILFYASKIMPKAPSSALSKPTTADLEVMPEVDDAQLGQELTRLYHDAEDGFRRVLLFGATFMRVEEIVRATRGANSPKTGPGAYGFKSWLADHAPEIAETSARRYRDITEALCGKFKIQDPERIFAADVAALPQADQAKRAKALAFVEDKSMRQIQLELDLVAMPKGPKPEDGPNLSRKDGEPASTPNKPAPPPIDADIQWWAELLPELMIHLSLRATWSKLEIRPEACPRANLTNLRDLLSESLEAMNAHIASRG